MDIRKFSVVPTSRLHLLDANDQPMYVQNEAGENDFSKPIAVNLYGPGSKPYAAAQAAKNNRMIDRLKRKGKSDLTAEQIAAEDAIFLTGCTGSWENMHYDALEGAALSKAVYEDRTIGFIAEQVGKHIGDWGNFSKASSPTLLSSSGS